jgi:ribosomal protein S1
VQEFDKQRVEDEEARAELEAALRVLKEGEVVKGQVVTVSDDSIMVDVGFKSEGIITLNELSHRPLRNAAESGLKVGDDVQVVVISMEGRGEGGLRLSIRRMDERAAWDRVTLLAETGEVVDAPVTRAVKGGLEVDLGLRAFLPASQVDRGYVNDLSKFVGQTIRVKVIELDRAQNKVILSRRQVLDSERDTVKRSFWESVEEGQVRTGTVKSLTDFGCFIDLGGVDGLLHISEMSYGRLKHPSEAVTEGEQVEVKILRLDREKEKVSLGLKQVLPDPWATVEEHYPEGTFVTGIVARLAAFGAFIELQPGIDGLVHISQLTDRRIHSPAEVVEVGQTVRAKIVGVSGEQRRISLSMKDLDEVVAD